MIEFWYFIRDTFLLKAWFTPLALVVGGIWTLFLFRSSNKHERDNNELLNQPRFKFFDSMNSHSEIKRSCDTPENTCRPMPDCCCNPECDKVHWFDIKNDGNFPAEQITISMVLEGEKDFRAKLAERVMGVKHLQAQESLQYSINASSLPSAFYNAKAIGYSYRFYVLLQYRSGYSKYWYRRVYQIDASKISREIQSERYDGKDAPKSVWARGIEFYGMSEQDCKCQKDVSILQGFDAYRKRRQQYTIEQYANNWVNDFYEVSKLGHLIGRIGRRFSRHKWWML